MNESPLFFQAYYTTHSLAPRANVQVSAAAQTRDSPATQTNSIRHLLVEKETELKRKNIIIVHAMQITTHILCS